MCGVGLRVAGGPGPDIGLWFEHARLIYRMRQLDGHCLGELRGREAQRLAPMRATH